MGNVTPISSGTRWSISQIAAEFAMARATVAKRIAQMGIQPTGKKAGYDVYRVCDIVAIYEGGATSGVPGFDPQLLAPTDRRAYYQSENERMNAEVKAGRLIPAGEVEAEMAAITKAVTRVLDTLPDQLERDHRVSPIVVEYLIGKMEDLKAELFEAVHEIDDDSLRVGS